MNVINIVHYYFGAIFLDNEWLKEQMLDVGIMEWGNF